MNFKANDSPDNKTAALEKKMRLKIDSIAAIAEELPGVLLIHNVQKQMAVEYISPRGEKGLNASLDEIKRMGTKYYNQYFNPEDAKEYVPRIIELLQRNDDDEIMTFFQQVRTIEGKPWSWYLSTVKIFMRDEQGDPLLSITMAFPVDPLHHVTSKVSRLLEENSFLRRNFHKFSELSEREREVLKLLALGKSAQETAEELYITVSTVETHRRNIKHKLDTHSFYELTQYARAFDLV
jgi:DNA-binding CsgD family transcriptional regulator